MRRRARWLILLALALGAIAVGLVWQRDMRAIEAQLAASARVIQTSFGPVAYATGGQGVPVLVIHGAGGGHDQGALMAQAFLPEGTGWIAPSRFGYPGSGLPADPSTAAQADAFAELLDGLGIGRVTVIAMSGGVPPALQFALRHPERVQALILLSLAPYAPLTAAKQELPVPIWHYDALFATDLPLWTVLRLSPRALAPIFDARPELTAHMTATEAAFLDAMIAAFLPVTGRRAGLANEGAAIDPAHPIDPGAIRVPVLIVHALDDRLAPVATAQFTAQGIPGALTLLFPTGGHLLLGHHEEVRQQIAAFLVAHVPAAAE
ncbi:alpha/beta fold hydrolase [Plastorhodobacter daqingensis]|uniref:Alpha/beta fold hydrolase n=1 Tax=Plastorhodobacter daqingensis TaxID=1387281 RepID=A0ABW2UKR7_9RHOB